MFLSSFIPLGSQSWSLGILSLCQTDCDENLKGLKFWFYSVFFRYVNPTSEFDRLNQEHSPAITTNPGIFEVVLLEVYSCGSTGDLLSTFRHQRHLSYLTQRAKIKVSLCPSVTENGVSREKQFLPLTRKEQKVHIVQNVMEGRMFFS